ncbi:MULTISPECIES: phosphodiesterase [Marinomonas]|uniref:3',5'-cyclic AMP phosphodiesterase CpdA n=1 Tax=Marinomonas polaris DSM 16579 TaxID=1122206 RepID=A0A1M5NAZ2_9GAMM|nr:MULTISPECIES: phosphodiesterase [Marinomonas]SHG86700.1 3',5'-cyclic AMP phosphodiesterase CpdA [Marinomonas polaris DSM 16579]
MLIAQLTDLHIKKNGKIAYQKVDTLQCLKNAVSHINALSPQPDWVVVTGDLGDFGTPEEYDVLVPELKKLKAPVKVIPGNHDHRDHLRVAFDGFASFDHPEYCHFSQLVDGYHLIGLDSSVLGKPYGRLTPESLAWLDAKLCEQNVLPTMIFLHHPPMKVGIDHMDVQKLLNDDALWQVLQHHEQVKGLVAGHLHRAIYATWNGLPVWVGPSHSHAVTLDLNPNAPSKFSLEPPAIQLFKLGLDSVVSHISYIESGEKSAGPFPFFDENNKLID